MIQTLSPGSEGSCGNLVPELPALLAGEFLAFLGSQKSLVLIHLLFILLHALNVRQHALAVIIVVSSRDGAVLPHLVEKTRDAFFHVRLTDVRGSLGVAVSLGRTLALGIVGGRLAVLRLLGLKFHLTLLDCVCLRRLRHRCLLSLLRVHTWPQAANVAR